MGPCLRRVSAWWLTQCLDRHGAQVKWYSRCRGFAADSHRPSRPQVNSVGFSSDGSRVVCGDYPAKKVTVLDASSGRVG